MAKIFLVLTIVVLLLTGGVGFMTKSRVDNVKSARDAANNLAQKTQADLTKTRGDLKKNTEELTAANKTVEEQKSSLTKAESDLAAAKADAEKATAAAQESEKAADEAKKALADAMTKKPENAPMEGGADAEKLKTDLAAAKKELEEAHQVQDTLKQREHESAEKLEAANRLVAQYQAGPKRAGQTGRVVAVNPGWNFVVVDVGDRKGAQLNAPLLVMRGGQTVARLRITQVEPTTSIADVVPGSINRGQTVQPGDLVVFAGRVPTPAPGEQGGAAPGANAPAPGGTQ